LSSLDDPALWYIARTPRNGFGRLAGSRSATARSLNAKAKIITRAGQQRYASAIGNSGAAEVIIPEYENGLLPDLCSTATFPLLFSVRDLKSGGAGNSPPLISVS
jgi:hypothetical protein